VTVRNPSPVNGGSPTRAASGVHSIQRTFELLEAMADAGGLIGLSELAERVGLPKPTVHRLVRTLVALGYVRQEPSRDYALGPRLARLVDASSKLLGLWAAPHLHAVVTELGESANFAMLDGDHVVDVSEVPGRHAMRMVSEVGRRALPHCTAAGKAMLAQLSPGQARAIVQRTGMPSFTPATITDPAAFAVELDRVRECGYATDDEEQELGVRCVAVAVPGVPGRAAVSISAPLTRMTDELIRRAIPILTEAAGKLAGELHLVRPTVLD
jgi:IclR family acetate operon transcriptional repressor